MNTIKKEILRLAEKQKQLSQEYKACFLNLINEVADQEPQIKVYSDKPRIYLVKASDLLGHPYSLSFYSWQTAKNILIDYLNNYPIIQWTDILEGLLKKNERGKESAVMIPQPSSPYMAPISPKFITKILQKHENK